MLEVRRTVWAAGEVRNFGRWKNSLAHMDKGRYAADNVVDYLQNKDTKALVFTDKHLLYLNLKRQRLRWAFPVADLSTVTTHGQPACPSPCAHSACSHCQSHAFSLFRVQGHNGLFLLTRTAIRCGRTYLQTCTGVWTLTDLALRNMVQQLAGRYLLVT